METENIAFTIQDVSENTQVGYIMFPNKIDPTNISISVSIETNDIIVESFNKNDTIISGTIS